MADSGATKIAEALRDRAVEPKLPGWVAFLLTALVSMAPPLSIGAIGYGEVRARLAALEQRMDRAAQERRDDHADTDRAIEKLGTRLDAMGEKLEVVRTDTAAIRSRIGGGRHGQSD